MDIGVIGVNHKSADLSFRESLVKNLEKMHRSHFFYPFSKVILNTCNRFEVYFHSLSLTEAHSHLLHDFTQEFNQSSKYKLYSYFGLDCFEHLAKVTSGLDSAIPFETEIQGQVKEAYKKAQQLNRCSKELHFLFQKSLKIGKEVRKVHPEQNNEADLVGTILDLKENLKQISKRPKILFVGASKINSKIINRIDSYSYELFLTNRTEEKGLDFASKYGIQFAPWSVLESWDQFDALVLATNSHNHLISKKEALQTPKLIIDLGVPRNACPKMGMNPQVKLLNIDQINKLVRGKRQSYLSKIYEIEKLISLKTLKQKEIFMVKNQWMRRSSAVS